jgi:Ca-activated chloride channel family protein
MTRPRFATPRLAWALAAPAALALAFLPLLAAAPPAEPLKLVFVFGSEKKDWLKDVTQDFQNTNPVVNGRPVQVELVPLGSGETVEEVVQGRLKAHLISPASGAYLVLGNAKAKELGQPPLVREGETKSLVTSPVVVAMWKPMAEALGWPDQPVGWADLRDLAASKDGWKSRGLPFGAFKFGQTHPEQSNSGLIALLSQAYAASGKKTGLTVRDIEAPETAAFLTDLQRSVIHYGKSTGFFGDAMFSNGVDYLNAAVVYESVVVDSYRDPKWKGKLPFPVVAVYPKEGTFLSDHPVGVVQRPWVTDDHKAAAKQYIDFLLQKDQQAKALKYGFRPASDAVPVADPIDAAHGADPAKPGAALLRPPDVEVMEACLKAWKDHKKHARVILVFDQSESMGWEAGKLENAKAGAKEIVKGLGDDDSMGLLVFCENLHWKNRGTKLKEGREELAQAVDAIKAVGQTALYDAIADAHRQLKATAGPDEMTAIVVLTDGQDSVVTDGKDVGSKVKFDELLKAVAVDNRTNLTRIYTIAYGSDADPDVLKRIADATKAKSYKGTKENIREVVKDILTFF